MKFHITMFKPDAAVKRDLEVAVYDAMKEFDSRDTDLWETEDRVGKELSDFVGQFIDSEIVLEFDTDDGTCRVLPNVEEIKKPDIKNHSRMQPFHVKRLLKLADKLETVPRKKFDMSTWWEKREECGTVACAAGWGCTIPSFRRAGFHIRRPHNIVQFAPIQKRDLKNKHCKDACPQDLHACAEFFGILYGEAYELFMNDAYDKSPTPKVVAKKIRRFVKNYGKHPTGKEA